MNVPTRIARLTVADDPALWRDLGFAVEGGETWVGRVPLALAGREAGRGIVSWALDGAAPAELDGLPTEAAAAPAPAEPATEHANTAVRIDHVVVLTPDLERTTGALEAAGMEVRRVREAGDLRQAFLRLGEVILEVVTSPQVPEGPARFWGITFAVADLDECKRLLGDRLGDPHDAVQPGRRIASLRREAGASLPLAFITAQ